VTPIHLDTSFLIGALVHDSAESVRLDAWLATGTLVQMSAVAWAELLCGPIDDARRKLAELAVGAPVPATGDDAILAAQLFNTGGRRRGSLLDCLIAAVAIRAGAALATVNPKDFQRLRPAGLSLADTP
jgi:predicted nucleic acid-binding protein